MAFYLVGLYLWLLRAGHKSEAFYSHGLVEYQELGRASFVVWSWFCGLS